MKKISAEEYSKWDKFEGETMIPLSVVLEIAKSIELVLIHNQNISTKQIAKEASRNFGFRSTSKKTATRINSVLDLMIANNKVKIENDIVELK